jgi:hypothetical protein
VAGMASIVACVGPAMGVAGATFCNLRSTSIWSDAGSISSFPPTMVAYDAAVASWTVGGAVSFLDVFQKTCVAYLKLYPSVISYQAPRWWLGSVSKLQLVDLLYR